jgi:hypothetical protein
MKRVKIRKGWMGEGRKGTELGRVFAGHPGQEWCMILWDDVEDPECFKSACLEPALPEPPPRGKTKADFRRHLNDTCRNAPQYRNGRYSQRTRPYGDYLYAQDRDKFDVEYKEWVNAR